MHLLQQLQLDWKEKGADSHTIPSEIGNAESNWVIYQSTHAHNAIYTAIDEPVCAPFGEISENSAQFSL